MRLAVTGSSGYLGRLVVSSLEEESQVAQILGLDLVDTPYCSAKFKYLRMDTRSPQDTSLSHPLPHPAGVTASARRPVIQVIHSPPVRT